MSSFLNCNTQPPLLRPPHTFSLLPIPPSSSPYLCTLAANGWSSSVQWLGGRGHSSWGQQSCGLCVGGSHRTAGRDPCRYHGYPQDGTGWQSWGFPSFHQEASGPGRTPWRYAHLFVVDTWCYLVASCGNAMVCMSCDVCVWVTWWLCTCHATPWWMSCDILMVLCDTLMGVMWHLWCLQMVYPPCIPSCEGALRWVLLPASPQALPACCCY